MFTDLKRFAFILVSGPHRSRTTLCAKAIGADIGHRVVLEEEINYSDLGMARALMRSGESIVLQAPFLAHTLHFFCEVDSERDRALIVMMLRDVAEIDESRARMRLPDGRPFHAGGIDGYRRRAYHSSLPDPALVYETWEFQKPLIRHLLEVDQPVLAGHRLWQNDRSNFHFRQTAHADKSQARA